MDGKLASCVACVAVCVNNTLYRVVCKFASFCERGYNTLYRVDLLRFGFVRKASPSIPQDRSLLSAKRGKDRSSWDILWDHMEKKTQSRPTNSRRSPIASKKQSEKCSNIYQTWSNKTKREDTIWDPGGGIAFSHGQFRTARPSWRWDYEDAGYQKEPKQ